jgi:hypothetical protein
VNGEPVGVAGAPERRWGEPRPPSGPCAAAGREEMTVDASEAAATNVLLRSVLGMAGPEGVAISDDDAGRAARFLAERAERALGGGLDVAAVAGRWAGRWRFEDVSVTSGAL